MLSSTSILVLLWAPLLALSIPYAGPQPQNGVGSNRKMIDLSNSPASSLAARSINEQVTPQELAKREEEKSKWVHKLFARSRSPWDDEQVFDHPVVSYESDVIPTVASNLNIHKRQYNAQATQAPVRVVTFIETTTSLTFTTRTTTIYGPSPVRSSSSPSSILATPTIPSSVILLATSSRATGSTNPTIIFTSPTPTPTAPSPTSITTSIPTSISTPIAAPTTRSSIVITPTTTTPVAPTASTLPGAVGVTNTGEGTFFAVGLGSCGITSTDSDSIVAISTLLMNTYPGATANPNLNPACGKMIRASYMGKSVTVKVEDTCMGCAIGDLDFSPSAFLQLAPFDVGRMRGVTWQWLN